VSVARAAVTATYVGMSPVPSMLQNADHEREISRKAWCVMSRAAHARRRRRASRDAVSSRRRERGAVALMR